MLHTIRCTLHDERCMLHDALCMLYCYTLHATCCTLLAARCTLQAYEWFHTGAVSGLQYVKDLDNSNVFITGACTKGLQVCASVGAGGLRTCVLVWLRLSVSSPAAVWASLCVCARA